MSALLIFLPFALACPDVKYSFTPCSQDSTRTAVYYWPSICDQSPPPPVPNLRCDIDCPAGQYLDMENGLSACKACPANTYSRGGATVFEGESFTIIDHNLARCWEMGLSTWEWNRNCTAWNYDGHYYNSGVGLQEKWLSTELTYFPLLVKPGQVTLVYRKMTKRHNSFNNGEFAVKVNGKYVLEDSSLDNGEFKTFKYPLPAGRNFIILEYGRYQRHLDDNYSADIKYFEIQGTEYAEHQCLTCPEGKFSSAGSGECEGCQANYYYDSSTKKCIYCGDNKYSSRGSKSLHDCKSRPPCTESHFSAKFGPCIDGKRSQVYEWSTPKICSETLSGSVQLPPSLPDLPCEKCSSGYYHAPSPTDASETHCTPCPEGTYAQETDEIVTECTKCPAGTYAPKVVIYRTWDPLPQGFENVCLPDSGSECEPVSGWGQSSDSLYTQKGLDESQVFVLSKTVNATDSDAYVKFEFQMSHTQSYDSRLYFSIDGVIHGSYQETDGRTVSKEFQLRIGENKLSWMYYHGIEDQKDQCFIYSITISGTTEGGASECLPCADGYVSDQGSHECTPCQSGFSSNQDREECVKCEGNSYSPDKGLSCQPCPLGSVVNKDKTACLLEPLLTYQNSTYYLSPLSGLTSTDTSGYTQGLCLKKAVKSLYCHETFYGPIYGNSNYFYISIGNPSHLDLPTYSHYHTYPHGYAYAIFDKKNLRVDTNELDIPDYSCLQDFSKIIVNLGTRLSGFEKTADGFRISYCDGAPYDMDSSLRYSTTIEFTCDKTEGDGWPVYQGQNPTNLVFRWRTKYACPVCQKEQLVTVKGSCYDGKRLIYVKEGQDCIIRDDVTLMQWNEECSVTAEVIGTWPVILGIVVLVVLGVIAVVLFGCFCKVKRQYQRLVEYKVSEDSA